MWIILHLAKADAFNTFVEQETRKVARMRITFQYCTVSEC